MPFGDGTGPLGGSRGIGRRLGQRRSRQPGGFGLGPGGNCTCPNCGATVPHRRGIPCFSQQCPKCGSLMTRAR
jgi:hypothetical protein